MSLRVPHELFYFPPISSKHCHDATGKVMLCIPTSQDNNAGILTGWSDVIWTELNIRALENRLMLSQDGKNIKYNGKQQAFHTSGNGVRERVAQDSRGSLLKRGRGDRSF